MSELFDDHLNIRDTRANYDNSLEFRPIDAEDMTDAEISDVLLEHINSIEISHYEPSTRTHYILNSVLLGLKVTPDIGKLIDSTHDYAVNEGMKGMVARAKDIEDDIHLAKQIISDKRNDYSPAEYREFRQEVLQTVEEHASKTNVYRAFNQLKETLPDTGGIRMRGLVQAHLLAYVLLYKNVLDKQSNDQ